MNLNMKNFNSQPEITLSSPSPDPGNHSNEDPFSRKSQDSTTDDREPLQQWSFRCSTGKVELYSSIMRDSFVGIQEYAFNLKQMGKESWSQLISTQTPVALKTTNSTLMLENCTIAEFLVMFASPKTLDKLRNEGLLLGISFSRSCNFSIKWSDFKDVPTNFMAAITDNFLTYIWLMENSHISKDDIEIDNSHRNILHMCIDEESPRLLKEILSNRNLFDVTMLRNLFKSKESVYNTTPLAYAALKQEPVMFFTFISTCPTSFVTEEDDLTGMNQSLFNFVLNYFIGSVHILQILKELINLGAAPDQCRFDRKPCIESIFTKSSSFRNPSKITKFLLNNKAVPSFTAFKHALKSDIKIAHIIKIAHYLLEAGGSKVLLASNSFEKYENYLKREDSNVTKFPRFEEDSVVVFMIKNKRIPCSEMKKIFYLIKRFASLNILLPDADNIAVAIIERCCCNCYSDAFNQNELKDILALILRVVGAQKNNAQLRNFYMRFYHALVQSLFNSNEAQHGSYVKEVAATNVINTLKLFRSFKVDFNGIVDCEIGLFSLFGVQVPSEVILKVLEHLPENFDVSIQDDRSRNMGTLAITRFSENFEMIYSIFKILKAQSFDFQRKVSSGETLLTTFIRVSGAHFDALETNDKLTAFMEESFFKVVRFLMEEDEAFSFSNYEFCDKEKSPLTAAFEFSHPTIAQEFLKIEPNMLHTVESERVLLFIKRCPEFLEFVCGSESSIGFASVSKINPLVDDVSGSEGIRVSWLKFVKHRHVDFIEVIIKHKHFSNEMQLIYDYLIHNREDMTEKFAEMEFSMFEQPTLNARSLRTQRVHPKVLRKIMRTNTDLEHHPLVTEYFRKFYSKSVKNYLVFIFYHLIFLIMLNGTMVNIVTPTTYSSNVRSNLMSLQYLCYIDNCTYSNLNMSQQKLVFYHENRSCISDGNDKCTKCLAYTADIGYCTSDVPPRNESCPFKSHFFNFWLHPGHVILIVLATLGLLREFIQFLTDVKSYLQGFIQNPMEISMYLFAIILAVNLSDCPAEAGLRTKWQFQLGAVSVLNSWVLMFFYFTKFPIFSIYVIMFTHGVKSGLGLLATFSWLILGFAFEFHLLFGNQYVFRQLSTSINKVWIMMTGEIDYEDMYTNHFSDPKDKHSMVYYEELSRLVLSAFVLLVHIILMNLLVGLIVGDVQRIRQKAKFEKWKSNMKFAESIEKLWRVLHYVQIKFRKKPPRRPSIMSTALTDVRKELHITTYILSPKEKTPSRAAKSGLHVVYLTSNVRLSSLIGRFLGFVPLKELGKRLQCVQKRKDKVRERYNLRQKLHPTDITDLIPQKYAVLPTYGKPWKETDVVGILTSDDESEVEDENERNAKLNLHYPSFMHKHIKPNVNSSYFEIGKFPSRQNRQETQYVDEYLSSESGESHDSNCSFQSCRSSKPNTVSQPMKKHEISAYRLLNRSPQKYNQRPGVQPANYWSPSSIKTMK